jgi:hypothetical protein
MSASELIAEIQKLPVEEQRKLLDILSRQLERLEHETVSESEIDRLLVERGIISQLPDPACYNDEDENFEPIEVTGKPLSQTIIEERR